MMEEEATVTTPHVYIEILKDSDPGWRTSEALFEDGWSLLCSGQPGVEGVALTAEDLGSEALSQRRIAAYLLARLADPERTERTLGIRTAMTWEASVWRLFAALLRLREEAPTSPPAPSAASTYAEVSDWLRANDWEYRCLLTLKAWAEANANELKVNEVRETLERATLAEEALHKLRSSGPTAAFPHLSLDAASPDPSDQAAERAMWSSVLTELRTGNLKGAVEVTRRVGEPALGAIIASLADLATHRKRRTAKRFAWEVLERPGLGDAERGVYGLLVGHPSFHRLCTAWEDRIYALVSGAVETRLEAELSRLRDERPIGDGRGGASLASAFAAAKSAQEPGFEPYAELLGAMALAGAETSLPEALLPLMAASLAATAEAAPLPRHLLRLYAQLTRLCQRLPTYPPLTESLAPSADAVLELFVQQLIEDGRGRLIPDYTAALSEAGLQTKNYAVWTETLKGDGRQRREALEAATAVGLDADAIAVQSIQRAIAAREELGSPSSGEATSLAPYAAESVPAEDEAVLEAFKWLLHSDSLRLTALEYSNVMVRSFLLQARGASAVAAMLLVPDGSYEMIRASLGDELSPPNEAILHEHFALRAYLKAEAAFGEWFAAYHAGPERSEEEVRAELSLGSEILLATAMEARRAKASADARGRWETLTKALRRDAQASLTQILAYPDGRAWLHPHPGATPAAAEEGPRLQRRLIPRVVDMLLHIYREYREPSAAHSLAVLIADEQRRLYELTGPVVHKLTAIPAPAH